MNNTAIEHIAKKIIIEEHYITGSTTQTFAKLFPATSNGHKLTDYNWAETATQNAEPRYVQPWFFIDILDHMLAFYPNVTTFEIITADGHTTDIDIWNVPGEHLKIWIETFISSINENNRKG